MRTRSLALGIFLIGLITVTIVYIGRRSSLSGVSVQDATAVATGVAAPEQVLTAALTSSPLQILQGSGNQKIRVTKIVEWPQVVFLAGTGQQQFKVLPLAPEKSDDIWLVITVEVNQEGTPTTPSGPGQDNYVVVPLGKDDIQAPVIMNESGKQFYLQSVGAHVGPVTDKSGKLDPNWVVTGLLPAGKGDYIFSNPSMITISIPGNIVFMNMAHPVLNTAIIGKGGASVLLESAEIGGGNLKVDWVVDRVATGCFNSSPVRQFSLLFEVPKSSAQLSWKIFDSPVTNLPQVSPDPLPSVSGESTSGLTLTSYTLQAYELRAMLKPCPQEQAAPSASAATLTPATQAVIPADTVVSTTTANIDTLVAATFGAQETATAYAAAPFTKTPTTPSPTPNVQQTLAAVVGATDTAVAIQASTMAPISTLIATLVPTSGVTANSQWTPLLNTFDGVEMMLVPPGCFMMGSDASGYDEGPVTKICFDKPL